MEAPIAEIVHPRCGTGSSAVYTRRSADPGAHRSVLATDETQHLDACTLYFLSSVGRLSALNMAHNAPHSFAALKITQGVRARRSEPRASTGKPARGSGFPVFWRQRFAGKHGGTRTEFVCVSARTECLGQFYHPEM